MPSLQTTETAGETAALGGTVRPGETVEATPNGDPWGPHDGGAGWDDVAVVSHDLHPAVTVRLPPPYGTEANLRAEHDPWRLHLPRG